VATLERAPKLYGRLRLATKQKKLVKIAPVITAVMILLLTLSG